MHNALRKRKHVPPAGHQLFHVHNHGCIRLLNAIGNLCGVQLMQYTSKDQLYRGERERERRARAELTMGFRVLLHCVMSSVIKVKYIQIMRMKILCTLQRITGQHT